MILRIRRMSSQTSTIDVRDIMHHAFMNERISYRQFQTSLSHSGVRAEFQSGQNLGVS